MRKAIKALIAAKTKYDVNSVIIHRNGDITAKLDADKTLSGDDKRRYLVCSVSQINRL